MKKSGKQSFEMLTAWIFIMPKKSDISPYTGTIEFEFVF